MATPQRLRAARVLREAEGYLELGLPRHALESLDRVEIPRAYRGTAQYLRGEAWRALECYARAIGPLCEAAELSPDNAHIWLALGWCYKRIDQLPAAIEALEHAVDHAEHAALVAYNLACYHSLAGNKSQSLNYLARAFQLSAHFRDMVVDEPDFDPLRNEAEFQALLSVVV